MSLRFNGYLDSATVSRLARAIRAMSLLLLTVSAADLTADVEDASLPDSFSEALAELLF